VNSAPTPSVADRLSEVARLLESEQSLDTTLAAIAHGAVGTIPGCEYASISATRGRRRVETLAATGDLARAVDRTQYETAEGPCLDTLFTEQTVRVPDMDAEARWPRFSQRACELGVRSMLAVQLFVQGDDLGALNLHSGLSDAFNDESEHVALLFATHAAVAMATAQERHQLHQAVSTRQLIGQAQGILMERFKVTEDRAFHILVNASKETNEKLVTIAEQLTSTGQLPSR
jgi:transcriptional regulator with GAF, ATPase, and Fis domain